MPPQPRSGYSGRRRIAILLLVVSLLLLLSVGGYLGLSATGFFGIKQASITTTQLNTTFTYEGLNFTLTNVQQSQNFLSDPNTANNGMLRLSLSEQNKTTAPITFDYQNIAHLLINGKSLAPLYVKSKSSLAPGASTSSLLDFAVSNGGTLRQISLQLGLATEAQLQIPLTSRPDLTQYQPFTQTISGTTTYFGLNWTLTNATISLDMPGKQAPSGMEYATISLTTDNTLAQEAISGSPFDFLHIKMKGQTYALLSSTIPISFDAGAMGKTGTATFLIPQNSTNCTMVFLSQDSGDTGQATINFTI
jgi:hypothetical protein